MSLLYQQAQAQAKIDQLPADIRAITAVSLVRQGADQLLVQLGAEGWLASIDACSRCCSSGHGTLALRLLRCSALEINQRGVQ